MVLSGALHPSAAQDRTPSALPAAAVGEAEATVAGTERELTTPEAPVRALEAALVAAGAADLTFDQRFDALEPVIAATHGLDHIARLVAGRAWRSWSEAQRATFAAAFERLTVALYAGRFEGLAEDRFTPAGTEDLPRGVVQVRRRFARPDDAPVTFDYLLQQEDGRWRIVNILVDGVSDLALRRAEFGRIADEAGFDGLIAHVEAEIDELASDANP